MPNTRKKIIKTVYNEGDDSDSGAGGFSDSGSDAQISEHSSSEEEEEIPSDASSGQEFKWKARKKKDSRLPAKPKKKFAKELYQKLNKQSLAADNEGNEVTPAPISVKDLTEADKLLPSFLNLSESDSSDDDNEPSCSKTKQKILSTAKNQMNASDTEEETKIEYQDVWANNIPVNSEEVAKRTFEELEYHKSKIEEAKASIMKYKSKTSGHEETDVTDLLAQGEELPMEVQETKVQDDSESEMEDWEEVKEAKGIPKQGFQLVLNIGSEAAKKSKKLDIEMMMKRKINRVKKENQVYMHKVHVLCWLGHGNYVSRVLNDQDILAATLSLVPSKECYPGERVDMKYVEQITTWYKDKLTLKQDKNEDKFKPKAPPLKEILLMQIKNKVVITKKYLVFLFVSMLRALGLQCRIMLNFVTLPIRPPVSELCSLSTKSKNESKDVLPKDKTNESKRKTSKVQGEASKKKDANSKTKLKKMSQVDGSFDELFSSSSSNSNSDFENISQLDGNEGNVKGESQKRKTRNTKNNNNDIDVADISPPKRSRRNPTPKPQNLASNNKPKSTSKSVQKCESTLNKNRNFINDVEENCSQENLNELLPPKRKKIVKQNENITSQKLNQGTSRIIGTRNTVKHSQNENSQIIPDESVSKITSKTNVTQADDSNKSIYFTSNENSLKRSRSKTANPVFEKETGTKNRAKSAPHGSSEKSKYFENTNSKTSNSDLKKQIMRSTTKTNKNLDDKKRVSHRDLISKSKVYVKNDVTGDLVHIIKTRVKEAKANEKKLLIKSKATEESDEDSDFLPEEDPKKRNSDSDDDFKPSKISPIAPKVTPGSSRKKDRRVLSSDDDTPKNKMDVWCEVFVEELEQWISVDVIKGKVHCTKEIYNQATHPVCYVVGWDNNNYLKDLTRRYVPHWNTVTRKQRAETSWWDTAVRSWLGPKTARDKEEDEQLNRMQLEAPLPKSIAEYKNHPLYALRRHLLKFEAIYPPDAPTLGFVRNEPVYSRDCVYVCRSRDTWLKEAKVVRLGEQPYKVVKARPKWDKLSNKLITDKPLEVFGPWQVQDYEPPVAENGIVPRNAYGNVELFKDCMLPKGTVHIKLPGLNRIAKKLNIDCAPAMTGFEFNGGWSHPVYDGFVVCKEYGEIITEAWMKDQEEQERKEREKIEARIYSNWRRLIKGLLIKERLKNRYGFEEPQASTSKESKKSKAPRHVVSKKR